MEQELFEKQKELAIRLKREIMQSAVLPCRKIKLSSDECALIDSKVGGLPYFPSTAGESDIPTDSKGRRLHLLAQINFAQVPPMEGFPAGGILQFFIADNDLYGCPLAIPSEQKDWRAVYYPDVDNGLSREETARLMGTDETELTPVDGEYKMSFEQSEEGLPPEDFRFEQIFVKKWNELMPSDDPDDEIVSLYDLDGDLFDYIWDCDDDKTSNQHKIGGYPYFTQADPRGEGDEKYDTLLFQLDSDSGEGIDVMWGDMGIGNFFINGEALRRLDFSDVLYNWDCG